MSRADYENFFKDADTDGSGTLTLDELSAILKKKGYKLSQSDVKTMFRKVDLSGDGLISLEEYLLAMGQQPPAVHGTATMRKVFLEFDKDGNGTIDKDELRAVFKEMGKYFSDAELERMIKLSDEDGSGTLDYEEFLKNVFGVQ